MTITAPEIPATWSPNDTLYLDFQVQTDCPTFLKEGSEAPVLDEPRYRASLVWPIGNQPIGEIEAAGNGCTHGAAQTEPVIVHVVLDHTFGTWQLEGGVPTMLHLEVELAQTDDTRFGPNPTGESSWTITPLPAVDERGTHLFNDGGPVRESWHKGGTWGEYMSWNGALLSNVPVVVSLQEGDSVWTGDCRPTLIDGSDVPAVVELGPNSSVPAHVGGAEFELTAHLPLPDYVYSSYGCTADRTTAFMVRVTTLNGTLLHAWPTEVVQHVGTKATAEPGSPSGSRFSPSVAPTLLMALALVLVAARRR